MMMDNGWVATHEGGGVLHFSVHDGWRVEPVVMDPDLSAVTEYRRGWLDGQKEAQGQIAELERENRALHEQWQAERMEIDMLRAQLASAEEQP